MVCSWLHEYRPVNCARITTLQWMVTIDKDQGTLEYVPSHPPCLSVLKTNPTYLELSMLFMSDYFIPTSLNPRAPLKGSWAGASLLRLFRLILLMFQAIPATAVSAPRSRASRRRPYPNRDPPRLPLRHGLRDLPRRRSGHLHSLRLTESVRQRERAGGKAGVRDLRGSSGSSWGYSYIHTKAFKGLRGG